MDPDTPLFGAPGDELTGVECRTLRASLNLERRHVVTLANAWKLGDRIATMDLVTSWERSKGRGYPPALASALAVLEAAVSRWAVRMAYTAGDQALDHRTAVIYRPLGARRIHQLLSQHHRPPFSQEAVDLLDANGGDFWQVLADSAVVRAAQILKADRYTVRVSLDKEPETPIGPSA